MEMATQILFEVLTDLTHVEIVNGRFEELEEFDCMVSI